MRASRHAVVAISLRVFGFCLIGLGLLPIPAAAQPGAIRTVCDPEEQPLFICETNRKDKYIAICATEVEVGKRWRDVQYRFGPENRAELVYPANASQGASKLFFSHEEVGTIYYVRIRFQSGGFTYLIESGGDSASDPIGNGAAGVTVTDPAGKTVAEIACIERPTMYPAYLRMALACDEQNRHGKAGCSEHTPHVDKAPRKPAAR
jgi:hypothetical protein